MELNVEINSRKMQLSRLPSIQQSSIPLRAGRVIQLVLMGRKTRRSKPRPATQTAIRWALTPISRSMDRRRPALSLQSPYAVLKTSEASRGR